MPLFQTRTSRPLPSEGTYSGRVRRLFTGTSSVQRAGSSGHASIRKDRGPRLGLQVLSGTHVDDAPPLQQSRSTAPTFLPPSVLAQPQLPSHALAHPLSRYLSEQVLLHNARDVGTTISVYEDPHVPGFGVDPEEQQLGELVHLRRQHRRRQRQGGRRSIFSRLNEQTIQSKLIGCVLSGMVLLIILSIYLSLALSSRRSLGQQFHVIFILIILLITILFCHSLVRLCMLVLLTTPPARPKRNHLGLAARHSSGMDLQFVDVERNGPVMTEGVGMGVDPVDAVPLEPPPPAYGLWRGSIRIDPNTLAPSTPPPLPSLIIPTRSHSQGHHRHHNHQPHHPQSYRSRSQSRTLAHAGPPIPPRRASSLQNGPPTPRNYSLPVPPLPMGQGMNMFAPPPPAPSTVVSTEMVSGAAPIEADMLDRDGFREREIVAAALGRQSPGDVRRPPSYISDSVNRDIEDEASRYSAYSIWPVGHAQQGLEQGMEQEQEYQIEHEQGSYIVASFPATTTATMTTTTPRSESVWAI